MGVEGLSKLLRDSKILLNHIDEVSGTMVGVDGYVLLHRVRHIKQGMCARIPSLATSTDLALITWLQYRSLHFKTSALTPAPIGNDEYTSWNVSRGSGKWSTAGQMAYRSGNGTYS